MVTILKVYLASATTIVAAFAYNFPNIYCDQTSTPIAI